MEMHKNKRKESQGFEMEHRIHATYLHARTGLSQGEILNVESVTKGDWRRARGTADCLARS